RPVAGQAPSSRHPARAPGRGFHELDPDTVRVQHIYTPIALHRRARRDRVGDGPDPALAQGGEPGIEVRHDDRDVDGAHVTVVGVEDDIRAADVLQQLDQVGPEWAVTNACLITTPGYPVTA